MAQRNGPVIILIIFAFGAAFVGGLFYYAHRTRQERYANAIAGAPADPLCFVAYDAANQPLQTVIDDLLKTKADFVLIENLAPKDLATLQKSIDFGKSKLARTSSEGAAILTRHYLYDGNPLPNSSRAVWGTGVVDGRKFIVAAGHFTAEDFRVISDATTKSRAPLVIGGTFEPLALSALPPQWKLLENPTSRSHTQLIGSSDWKFQDMKADSGMPAANWAILSGYSSTTQPATRESSR